jgi:hypothetical protein
MMDYMQFHDECQAVAANAVDIALTDAQARIEAAYANGSTILHLNGATTLKSLDRVQGLSQLEGMKNPAAERRGINHRAAGI